MSDFSGTLGLLDQLLAGATVTLGVSAFGFVFGMAVGLTLLFFGRARSSTIRRISSVYVSFVRGTPLLVQIFLVYYALPDLLGVNIPPLAAGVLALGLNSGAFVSEIFRGGLTRIPIGQYEAAQGLSLPRSVTWRKVIIPQLLRITTPPLFNEFTMVVKASAILSVIAVVELTRTAQNIMNVTYRPIEAFTMAAIIYFVMLFTLSLLVRYLESKTQVQR